MFRPFARREPGRPYCEAFPIIDIHELLRATAAGSVFAQFVNEDGVVVGLVSVQELTETVVTLFYEMYGTRNVVRGAGTVQVEIERRKGGKYWSKPVLVCPQCGCDANRLYYVRGEWACKYSHDILSITQRLDQVNKAIYRREVHQRLLADTQRGAAQQKKIEKSRQKYGAAVSLLANETRDRLPEHLTYRTFGNWLAPGETPEKPDLSGVAYGWEAGMAGQLPGLAPPVVITFSRTAAAIPQVADKEEEERRKLEEAREAFLKADEQRRRSVALYTPDFTIRDIPPLKI